MAKMSRDEIRKLQEIIGTDVDGIWGPKSRAAYSAWLDKGSQPSEDTFVSPEDTINAAKTTNTNLGDEYNVAEDLGETKLDPNYGRDPRAKSGFDPMDSFVAPQMDNLYDKSTRIAEIQRRLDEIKREKAKYDMEGKMGEYKFLYDADPSTYMTHQQNLRSNEQTNAIRKASEDATKASQAQTAWRQLLIDEETAKYEKMEAENQVRAAQQSGDAAAYRDAKVGLSRINAKMNRLAKDKDEYRNRFAEMLGVSREEMGEPANGDWDEDNDVTYGKLKQFEEFKNGIPTNIKDLRIRLDKMQPDERESKVNEHRAKINNLTSTWESIKDILSPEQRKDVDSQLADYSDAIVNFGKKQGVKMTREKFLSMNFADMLATKNAKMLRAYGANGWKLADPKKNKKFYDNLEKAINRLESESKGN